MKKNKLKVGAFSARDKIAGVGKWVTRIFGIVFVAVGIALVVYALGGW